MHLARTERWPVVADYDVFAGEDDPAHAFNDLADPSLPCHLFIASNQDRFGIKDRLPHDPQSGLSQRLSRLHDIRDDIGNTQRDRNLDGSIQPYDLGIDSSSFEVVPDHIRIRRRDPEPAKSIATFGSVQRP